MKKIEKFKTVEKLKNLLKSATGIYFADLSKVKAKDIADLRQRFLENAVTVKVVKNRLAILAFRELGFDSTVKSFLTGPTTLILSTQDPITPARLLKDLIKKLTEIKIKGAYIDQTIFSSEQFDYLANLPSRPELETSLVSVLSRPLYDLVMVLDGLLANLIFTLKAILQKKETNIEITREQN